MPDSTLTRMYRELLSEAQTFGIDRTRTLRNGARMAVRERDGVRAVTFSRPDAELGAVELETFIKHCEVPSGAERIPVEGQRTITSGGRTWFAVSFRWPLTGDMFAEGLCDASS